MFIPAKERAKIAPTDAINKLKEMAFTFKCFRSPNIPRHAMPRPKYGQTTANELTACVRDFLVMRGHHANRVNTQGNYSQKLGKFIHSGSTRGASDLNCIINGLSVQIEIKVGKDKLSEAQIKQRDSVQAAGGIYIVVKNFDDFIDQYCEIVNINRAAAFTIPDRFKSGQDH